ncbi:MAG: translation initiation factor IF-2 subunit beta [Candidatus Aenigmatarchaeota archaeon]
METYEQMLKRAIENMPKRADTGERFEMPVADVLPQGTQTIFRNFSAVCEALRRDPKHLLKYLSKELASPASIDGARAVFQSKIPQKTMQAKLEAYVKEYVICKECTRPDTRLEKEDRLWFLRCEACGAKSAVKGI